MAFFIIISYAFWVVWGKNTTKFTEPSQEPDLNFLHFIVRKKGKMSIINWIRAMIQALGGRRGIELGKALGPVSSIPRVKGVRWSGVE